MDVVSFVAAVTQLIDLTSKAVSYFNDAKDAPKERAKLAREAASLLVLFTDLKYRMEETNSTDPWSTGLRSLGGEGGPLMELKVQWKIYPESWHRQPVACILEEPFAGRLT